MRTVLGTAVTLAAALTLSACGGSDDGSGAAPTREAPKIAAEGPHFPECAGVSDEEITAIFQLPTPVVTRNSVGCVWEIVGGPSVSFSWYRGSPIGREAAGSDRIGRPPDKIEIEGQPGFVGSLASASICEIGVQFGDDFVHWSVTYAASRPAADPCTVAKELAALSVKRRK